MSLALMIFGDNNINMADGALAHMLLLFANQIVSQFNMHPYRTGMKKIQFYTHPSDVREIPDQVMIYGMAGLYAGQQRSDKAPTLMAQYYQLLNTLLWEQLNGNTNIEARIFDKGPRSKKTNGLREED